MIKIIYGLLETNHVCIYIYILYFKNELTIYLRERERERGGGASDQLLYSGNFNE